MSLTFRCHCCWQLFHVDLIFSGMAEFPQLGKDVISTDFKMTPGEAFISAVQYASIRD